MQKDFDKLKKVYVIGIKGSGVIAAVEILHFMGARITGSDVSEKFFTDEILGRLGITYFEKFDPKNIPDDADLVVYSTAYNENNNVEFQEALRRNLPMVSYPEILEQLFNDKYGIAVCGTHGKTTTSALLAFAMQKAGADPTAIVGSKVLDWGGGAISGQSEYFVAEADEFQNKLRFYNPKAVVLTSLDFDHPDYFENYIQYKKTFVDFVKRIPSSGFLVVWGDSTDTLEVARYSGGEAMIYGFGEECDYQITNYKLQISDNQKLKPTQSFDIFYKDKSLGRFGVQLIGKHNVLNAAAVVAVCHKLNLDMKKVGDAIRDFKGTARRFEHIGQHNGAILIDDYAHHPEEIRPTLRAAREIYPDHTIWAVFHPHTFTRTKALLSEFAQSFEDADKVLVLDIYGSARETQGGVHSKDLVALINKYGQGKADYVPTIAEAVDYLKDTIGEDDVVITIGAGSVWEVAKKLRSVMGSRS